MSDALTDITRDDRKTRLFYEIKCLVVEDGKTEKDEEVIKLVDEICSIPRGYIYGGIGKSKLIDMIKNKFGSERPHSEEV